ncbi:M48 family metallopeptidase [Streptomyces misionensis]|uniref:M48 family metallopeptidase n=1 Tax=Streptomyces misionensis TaxID=67331 RepID=UPI00343D0342
MARQERALERVLADGPGTPSWNAALVGALVLATAVNLVTVALVGTGVWLLVAGTWPERILGAVEIVVALVLRPRFGRMPRHTLDAAAAPTLYAVAKRVAAELGTKPVDAIAVDARYGSGCTVVGPRRRRVLVIGLPLWETLTADQRLALLGHDLGRASTRGGPSGAWIQMALDALTTWADMIRPTPELEAARQGVVDANAFRPDVLRQNTNISLGQALAQPLQNLLAHGVLALHRLLGRLDDLSGRQSQYRADEMAVRVSSTTAADGLLRALLLSDTARFAVERAARSGGDVWAQVRASLVSVPDTERERLLRLARLRGDSTDGSSAPTYFRIQFVNRIPGPRTANTLSGEEAQAIDEELLPLRATIANELRSEAGQGLSSGSGRLGSAAPYGRAERHAGVVGQGERRWPSAE